MIIMPGNHCYQKKGSFLEPNESRYTSARAMKHGDEVSVTQIVLTAIKKITYRAWIIVVNR